MNAVIIDYGLGNLFSVKRACEQVGLNTLVSSKPKEILASDAIILPGVGAFGDAMENLARLDLISTLKNVVKSNKPLLGICLGMQLLMTKSYEFGEHDGLDILKGSVKRFTDPKDKTGRVLKVPQVGWNGIYGYNEALGDKSPLYEGINDGEFMYFVHSYYVIPEDKECISSVTKYGDIEFCSSVRYRNVYACQFHPERSGLVGLKIYQNFAELISK